MLNVKLNKIENSIDSIIDRMSDAKEAGHYYKLHAYNDILKALIAKWEATAGESLENNARAYNKIVNKLSTVKKG